MTLVDNAIESALAVVEATKKTLEKVTLERDALRTMVVSIYRVAGDELAARWELYDCEDINDIPDSRVREEIRVLERFMADARKHVELIQQVEAKHDGPKT